MFGRVRPFVGLCGKFEGGGFCYRRDLLFHRIASAGASGNKGQQASLCTRLGNTVYDNL